MLIVVFYIQFYIRKKAPTFWLKSPVAERLKTENDKCYEHPASGRTGRDMMVPTMTKCNLVVIGLRCINSQA